MFERLTYSYHCLVICNAISNLSFRNIILWVLLTDLLTILCRSVNSKVTKCSERHQAAGAVHSRRTIPGQTYFSPQVAVRRRWHWPCKYCVQLETEHMGPR